MVATLAGLSTKRMEAAIVDRRLRSLTREQPLSPLQLKGITDNLQTASQLPITVSQKTLIQVREAIRVSALKEPGLPKIDDAAKALTRLQQPNQLQSEAGLAYVEGVKKLAVALAPEKFSVASPIEATEAVAAFTRAIELAGNDTALRIDALLGRATAYNALGKYDDALADTENAYRQGALDLSSVLSLEGAALVGRHRPEDLKRAIEVITAALQLSPPAWFLSIAPRMEIVYRSLQFMNRCIAYYGLGEYAKAVSDCEEAVDLMPRNSVAAPALYVVIVFSYLKLGDVDAALKAASELLNISHDHRAASMLRIIQDNRSNPELAIERMQQQIPWDFPASTPNPQSLRQ
jgi:tetratricopeptide (TPR) repeat protein